MNSLSLFAIAGGLCIAATTMADPNPFELSSYDVNWTTPSKDAAGSMPIGNGEVVVNTWVEEATGDLLILIGRTDSLSEISRVLKVGRVRVSFHPPLFRGKDFGQKLSLKQGVIELKGDGEELQLFVDSDAPVIHVKGSLKKARTLTAELENWRSEPRPLPDSDKASAWSAQNAPFPLVESADVVMAPDSKTVVWRHQNKDSIVPKLWELQTLTGLKGLFDPIKDRTFGGAIRGVGLVQQGSGKLRSSAMTKQVSLRIATHTSQRPATWEKELIGQLTKSSPATAEKRTKAWWGRFWNRSHVFIKETPQASVIPQNDFPLRKGKDSNGQNVFRGKIEQWSFWDRVLSPSELSINPQGFGGMPEGRTDLRGSGLTLKAVITPTEAAPGRIFDKLTAGTEDGFLFDTHPGTSLRLIVGRVELSAANCLKLNVPQTVAATFDPATGEAAIYLDGKRVAHRPPQSGRMITKGYVLQRYVQACQGRGEFPIKFNGGYYTVEPTAMGRNSNPDFRNWGDAHWFQNVRHIYHPMLASGDTEMMEPFWRLYEKARPLAEARSTFYHGSKGAYFPETMTVFGTYAGNDYGWDRTGLKPNQVQCPWWDDAWNQGPELIDLMLDRWEYVKDDAFLTQRVLPMAESILLYFDTRFKKDAKGKIILDPTQVVETYWEGVINDTPTVAGLIAVTERLTRLPDPLVNPKLRAFFEKMKQACPPLPLEAEGGKPRIAPAEAYEKKISNVENGELYAVWPFRVASLGRPGFLAEAKNAYAVRKNRLDTGWGYDGNVAALLGMTEEAARILQIKVRNSHPAYRWPATWGPNFDWLPDQNHGGNLLNTTHLMLLQSDPLSAGGKIRILPAWPKDWDVDYKLQAPGKTTVEVKFVGGKLEKLVVTPESRRKDVVLPDWLGK